MGHTRLGTVPKTRKWNDLVKEMAAPAQDVSAVATAVSDVDRISGLALDAAQSGLEKASHDPGVRYTFYLLTQIALASRASDWRASLAKLGIRLSDDSTVFDLTAELQDTIDRYLNRTIGGDSDLSEMAQQAAGEAIASLAGPRTINLFGTSGDDLQNAVRTLSTKKGFGELGQRFFGRFVARFLNFYLSRVTASNLGSRRMQHLGDLAQFNEALRTHCDQSARILRDFCGEWYSKTEYQEGIDAENTSRFLAVALQKLRSELEQQKAGS